MKQHRHHWLRILALSCVAAVMLLGLPAYALPPSTPAFDATEQPTEPSPVPTSTAATDTPTPAPPTPTPMEPTPAVPANVLPLGSFSGAGEVAVVEPFALLARARPPKATLTGGPKLAEASPSSDTHPPVQVGRPDANLSANAAGRRAVVTLINQSDVEICYVYFSSSDNDTWGDDWLGNDSVPPGESYDFTVPEGTYDVRAKDCDGQVIDEHRNVEISGEMNWTIGRQENKQRRQDRKTEPAPEEPELEPVVLSQYLCCGYTVGGTRIWGISFPEGWQVTYLPNDNPNDFVGTTFYDPGGSMAVTLIPSGWTPMGTAMDTGNVDQFLDAYTALRAGQDPGFTEFSREGLAGLPMYRVWSGTWERGGKQYWESYVVGIYEMPYVEGMPRGTVNLMGPRAESSEWNQVKAIYNQMLGTMQVEVIGKGGYTPPPPGPSRDPEETATGETGGSATAFWELVFCPRACHWEHIDLNSQPAGWQWCCSDGCVGSLSEVPCTADQCNASCAR
jgi:hypothetical protein